MHVKIERSGGFAGMAMQRQADTASMDELDATTLERLAHDALATPVPALQPMPDAFQYDVSIDGNSQTLIETSMPPEWQRLIEWVQSRAGF